MEDPRLRYYDNAATTPLDPRVLAEMLPWMSEDFGNANSIHSLGLKARTAVERAREQVALAISAEDPSEIVFTSGATEANNWVLAANPGAWVSPVEHSSIWEQIGPRGLRTGTEIPESGLVSLMRINNETGAIYAIPKLAGGSGRVHVDATQALGKIPFSVDGTSPAGSPNFPTSWNPAGGHPVDLATFSAHKFHGPKGVGVLYARGADFPAPLLMGGEQEAGHRAGTLNVPAIVGLGAAIQLATDTMSTGQGDAYLCRCQVLNELEGLSDWHRNGVTLPPDSATGSFPPGIDTSDFILSLSFLGVEGEAVVIEMDRRGYAISSGAACSSRSTEPSHVLTALGYSPEWLRGTVRISFGRFNNHDAAEDMARELRKCVESLRSLGRQKGG